MTMTDRRTQVRSAPDRWQSSLTEIEPNKILIRGYPLDEMMGRLGFAEAVYLLLMGELPTPAIGRMLNAVLVSSIDHGVTPPSRKRMHDSMSPPWCGPNARIPAATQSFIGAPDVATLRAARVDGGVTP